MSKVAKTGPAKEILKASERFTEGRTTLLETRGEKRIDYVVLPLFNGSMIAAAAAAAAVGFCLCSLWFTTRALHESESRPGKRTCFRSVRAEKKRELNECAKCICMVPQDTLTTHTSWLQFRLGTLQIFLGSFKGYFMNIIPL